MLDVRAPGEHPGAALKRELARRGCTQTQFAVDIQRPASALCDICNGKKAITAATALQLEAALGIPAREWVRAQADHELEVARQRRDRESTLDPGPVRSWA